MAAWATTAEIQSLTGVSVTEEQLAQAQGLMDVYSGVVIDAEANLRARDRRLMRMATAYQAAWQSQQVDVLTRMDVATVNQDGVSATPANEDALFLAPHARRCLAQLSWKRTRSVRIECGEPRYANIEAYQAAWLRDEEPADDGDWRPL